ncbi:DUF6171 family protein [Inconstantimicrobium mannanitabidum]|uniref:Uncharacterized protein n=1 Tax=Inconstantimicrobium mannanitabidum TaxID=1604901 RepID=A0ACB5RH31_9CLOT|nr:DUF6171 family protein [Clostridium sp. TW13]GKX68376.1 hypothetical protein rsdtw13_36340 [Clostridium sp. TW13]
MTKFCRKCLLSESNIKQYYENIVEYIKVMPIDIKADDETYKHRLSICKQCNHLINGMCGKCGCFVELRAAKKINYCPSEDELW